MEEEWGNYYNAKQWHLYTRQLSHVTLPQIWGS